jgi:hypothetical protein
MEDYQGEGKRWEREKRNHWHGKILVVSLHHHAVQVVVLCVDWGFDGDVPAGFQPRLAHHHQLVHPPTRGASSGKRSKRAIIRRATQRRYLGCGMPSSGAREKPRRDGRSSHPFRSFVSKKNKAEWVRMRVCWTPSLESGGDVVAVQGHRGSGHTCLLLAAPVSIRRTWWL